MSSRLLLRLAIMCFGVVAILSAPSGVVSAHTDLESTSPAEGETVMGPLTEITLNYTKPTTISEKGFEILRSDGTKVTPIEIQTTGDSYVLVFNPGLTEGTYAVGWEVLAEDGHPLSGAFQFSVTNPPDTSPPPTTPTTTDPDAPTSTDTAATPTTLPGDLVGTTPASSTTTSTTTSTLPPASTEPVVPTTSPTFGNLVNQRAGQGSFAISRLGHFARFGGTVCGVGALAALLWAIQTDKSDIYAVLNAARLSGVAIATGGAIEWAGYQEVAGGGLSTLLSTRTGGATVLTVLGGVLMLFGLTERNSMEPAGTAFRWRPGARSAAGIVGAVAVLLSFGFDGHGANRGPGFVMVIADIAHVAAAAVWAGGVAALALVAWLRRRRSQPGQLAQSVVRFSPMAAISMVAVFITGLAMTLMIINDPGSPTESPWGRALIVKMVFVVLTVVAGAFNRFSLVPAINEHPDDPVTARRVRFSLTIEGLLFVAIIGITAVLVTLSLNKA